MIHEIGLSIVSPFIHATLALLYLILPSVQILCDVIQSGGIIGGPYVDPRDKNYKPVDLIFCNPDLIWKTDFPNSRLGQGGFKEAFKGVYKVNLLRELHGYYPRLIKASYSTRRL